MVSPRSKIIRGISVVGIGSRNGIRQCRISVRNGIEPRDGSREEVSKTTSEPQPHYKAVGNWYYETCT